MRQRRRVSRVAHLVYVELPLYEGDDPLVVEVALREKLALVNGRRSPLVMGNAPVTDQVLQISQER
jgi:hypothetical protein